MSIEITGASITAAQSNNLTVHEPEGVVILAGTGTHKRMTQRSPSPGGNGIDRSVAGAAILVVSRQRVHQLADEGTFKHRMFYGMKWLSREEVVSFAKLNRHQGENQYTPSVKQL